MADWLNQELFSVTTTGLILRFVVFALLIALVVRWVFGLRRQFREQNARIKAQLQREIAFSNLGSRLSAAVTQKDAAKVIADTGQELLGWDAYALRLFSEDVQKAESIMHLDTVNGRKVEVPFNRDEVSPMMLKVLNEGPQLILRQQGEDTTSETVPFGDKERRSASLMFVPIRNGTKVIGMLSIQSYQRNAYNQEHLDVLQKLADHCGGALERIRTQHLLRDAYDEMEERVKARTRELLQANTLLHEEIELHKRTEAALAFEQHVLKSLMDSVPDYIYFKDAQGRFTRVNTAFANQFGNCEAEEMLGKTDFDYLSQEAAQESFDDEQRIIETGKPIIAKEEHEFWLNGHEWWCLTSKMPFRDAEGRIVGTFGVTRDITQRKKAEEELQRREKMWRSLFENSGDAIFIEDLDGVVLDVNPAGCKLHGMMREELVGKHVSELVPPEKRQEVNLEFPKLIRGEISEVESVSWTIDGRAVPVAIRAARIDYDGRPALLLHVRDITRRKQYEEALQQTQVELERRVKERTAQLSIANEELVAEIAERKQAEARSTAFSNLGFRLSQARTGREAAEIILDVADNLLGWDAAYIHLYSSDYTRVVPILLADLVDGKRVMTDQYLKDSALSERDKKIVSEGAELLLRDPAEEKEDATLSAFGSARRSLSLMFVPIRDGAKVIGGLSIQSYSADAYSRDDLNVLQGLADFCSGTLERIEAEQALRLSEERFEKAFRSSPVPMTLSRLEDGRYIDVNDAMFDLMGFRREEMIGKTSLELGIWPSAAERDKMVEAVRRHRSVRDMECELRTKAGRPRKTLLSVESMDFRGEHTILVSVYDITDRLNLEEQLRQSQKMEAVGQLAAGVAHDFNNILTIIQGHITLLMSMTETDSTMLESLSQMSMATDSAANLTRQLLTFSRKQVMQPKPIDLNEVVGTTSKMLQRLLGENISLHFNYSPHLPTIHADAGMIEQILMNLAVNARDAMPHGGRLVISTESVRVDEAYVQKVPEARQGQFICLTVSDTGCGMDPATMERIFEPFFTTKEVGKGTGLGLATVYGIVKQHQGWIQVQSELGDGTTFKIFFPMNPRTMKTAEQIVPAPVVDGGKETILVVEDEPALRDLVRGVLELYGYRVIEAAHGKEALVLWSKHKDEIDLLLTDMVMPEGISGLDLSEQLRKEDPALRVIYTSGYSMDLFSNRQKMTEGVNFLPKPYQPKALAKMIREALDQ